MMICSSLLYRERAPLNCLPCHYKMILKSWTWNCSLPSGGDCFSLTVMIESVVLLFLVNVELWPHLCLCSVCVYASKEEALCPDTRRKEGWCRPVTCWRQLPPINQCLWPLFFSAKQNLTLWSFFSFFLFKKTLLKRTVLFLFLTL